MSQDSSDKKFKDTLNLPRTDFPIRVNAEKFDKEILERWESEDLFYKSFIHNKGNKKFILHDGPPYANGNIHLGHAYNKILKDILCKSKRMEGYQVPVTPGWDCHGLPIELKVKSENPDLNRIGLMNACREYAQKWIDTQRSQFKDLGVLMNWEHPYITMDPSYEADIVKAFGVLVKEGFVERKNKTVPWCYSCSTVLASAEIEYQDRKDPSIYVLFKLNSEDQKRLFPDIEQPINLLVWTTTPWTIPLNRAVMLKTGGDYKLVDYDGTLVVIGAKLDDDIAKVVEKDKKVLKEFNADYLANASVEHPITGRKTPVIFEDSVGTDEGTAVVHTAPGCGPIDYEIGVKNKLEIYSPITASGEYTSDIEPKELANMPVTDGQIWVIKNLAHNNKLFAKKSIKHSYPHCWRCHSGLIFRATPQWFFDLERQNNKQKALKAVENIKFIPERGRNFLRATIENRWEWCLSRQRTWGAPIPALLCSDSNCDYNYTSQELSEIAAIGINEQGIEYWAKVSVEEILEKLREKSIEVNCNSCPDSKLVKEQDILDVWFDSGVSHYAVLYHNKELAYPADIYLEGIDQYRGWFQSSLLTSLVLEKEPAMKSIMAHGFTVDEKSRKMSKSLGNVVAPEDIIKKLGTDGLRLWVSSIGHNGDAVVSETLLKNIAEVYRKIRNTARFLLSNLYDFDINKDAVNFKDLLYVDKYALLKLNDLNKAIIQEYNNYNFTGVYHKLADYTSTELSSFYLDIIKDRLYVAQANGVPRKSAQIVVWYILDTLTKLMAPILSFTAELISDHYQVDKKESIHLQDFNNLEEIINKLKQDSPNIWPGFMLESNSKSQDKYTLWSELKEIRDAVLKAIETERQKGDIKHSLEAKVRLYINNTGKFDAVKEFINSFDHSYQSLEEFFKELFIVSQLELLDSRNNLPESSIAGLYVEVVKAEGQKCPRCWNWSTDEHEDNLCKRCEQIVNLI